MDEIATFLDQFFEKIRLFGIEVIDYSKSDQYYTEIYDAFFNDITKTDASIQATYNKVLNTLNAIEGK